MKKVNTKTSKKIAAVILAAVAAFSVMGCSVKSNFTSTETETVTDADGNTTTTTTTNDNGKVTTETTTATAEEAMASYEEVPVDFTNEMGWDIKDFYIKMSDQDEWSDSFLSEDSYIDNGTTADGITVNYDMEQRFIDIRMADSEGAEIEFDAIELPAEGANHIEIVFGFDEASGEYTATVNAE